MKKYSPPGEKPTAVSSCVVSSPSNVFTGVLNRRTSQTRSVPSAHRLSSVFPSLANARLVTDSPVGCASRINVRGARRTTTRCPRGTAATEAAPGPPRRSGTRRRRRRARGHGRSDNSAAVAVVGGEELDGPVRHAPRDQRPIRGVRARTHLKAPGLRQLRLEHSRLRAASVAEAVHRPGAHRAVRAGGERDVVAQRVPHAPRARRAVPLGVLHVPDVHVPLVALAELAAVTVKHLGLRAAGDDEEPVAARRPRQRVHGVAVAGRDLAERSHVALHAVEVVHAHGVVVRAGEQARAGVLQRERADDVAMALHLRLVGHGQALVALVLGIPVAARVVLVPVDDGRARRATRVGEDAAGGSTGPPRVATGPPPRVREADSIFVSARACSRRNRRGTSRATPRLRPPRQEPRLSEATPPGARAFRGAAPRRLRRRRTRTNETPARPAAVCPRAPACRRRARPFERRRCASRAASPSPRRPSRSSRRRGHVRGRLDL